MRHLLHFGSGFTVTVHRPTFFTGRHTTTAFVVLLLYLSFAPFLLRSGFSGAYLGAETMRYIRASETLGVVSIFLIGICLIPGLPQAEIRPRKHLRIWYFVSTLGLLTTPLFLPVVTTILIRLKINPVWKDVIGSKEYFYDSYFPRLLQPSASNTIVIGAISLIALRILGVLGGALVLVLTYPTLITIAHNVSETYGPYVSHTVGHINEPHWGWCVALAVLAALTWSLDLPHFSLWRKLFGSK